MYCTNCGGQLPENANVCPFCGTTVRKAAPVQPVNAQPVNTQPVNPYPVNPRPLNTEPVKTPLPALALGFGIGGLVLGYIGYFVLLLSRGSYTVLLTFLAALLGIGAIIFGAIGLRRSIRTNGRRKYVAGIVLSAIGLACGAGALLFSFFGLFMRSVMGRYL